MEVPILSLIYHFRNFPDLASLQEDFYTVYIYPVSRAEL